MTGFNIRDLIGLILLGAFIGAGGVLFFVAIPDKNEQLITYMLGQLSGFVAAVVALHYVTKAGEKELDEQRTANTGEALAAINKAMDLTPSDGKEVQDVNIVNPKSNPANVKETKHVG